MEETSMATKIITGNRMLAKQIKSRRKELNLTIEEAASRAGVGTKTWYRYEAGESIRMDKCKGICKALNWHTLPDQENEDDKLISIQEYKKHAAWSPYLEELFGVEASLTFAVGSDILLDNIEQDLTELASMPVGSHIGQLNISWLEDSLPQQFLMCYNYDFLYRLKCTLCNMRSRAKCGSSMMAHSVLEELILYLCNEESIAFIELCGEIDGIDNNSYDKDWVFDLFGDMDIVTFLYSDLFLTPEISYHFSHWYEQQFFMESTE